ncbi:hypothetical protein CHARACLAT_022342 [Characodon lateralis]|uniref:Uncharacterized protein n=1 Tax=Characodon lateralis TaxID=208331 RepID=A0ABU7F540_9TELE|nr:hypothetical protein [Characodon lateralis]
MLCVVTASTVRFEYVGENHLPVLVDKLDISAELQPGIAQFQNGPQSTLSTPHSILFITAFFYHHLVKLLFGVFFCPRSPLTCHSFLSLHLFCAPDIALHG